MNTQVSVKLVKDTNTRKLLEYLLNKIKSLQSLSGNTEPTYKVYTALLTQSGTDDPIAIVLENTIGDIVWSRTAAGTYAAELEGAFILDKTFSSATFNWEDSAEGSKSIGIARVSDDRVVLRTSDGALGGTGIDNLMTDITSIEIKIYN